MAAPTDFQLKQGDTSTRTFRLREPDGTPDGKAFNLTGYAPGDLAFFFELAIDANGNTITPGTPPQFTGGGTFVIVDAEAGIVTYTFDAADTATAGIFRGEIEALLGAARNTFPQDDYFTFENYTDLGDQ